MGNEEILWIRDFGAGYGQRVVLSKLDLTLDRTGITALMGPVGVGKSTLIRIVCGVAQQNANLKTWGDLRYLGLLPGEAGWPSLVSQNARLMVSTVFENLACGLVNRSRLTQAQQYEALTRHLEHLACSELVDQLESPVIELELYQQRMVAVLRQTLSDPVLLCVDEPCTDLEERDACKLLELIERWSHRHAVLMASHNQRQVRRHATRVALLVHGYIVENATTRDFFSRPNTTAAQQFIRTGSCNTTEPGSMVVGTLDAEAPEPEPLPPKARQAMSAWAGPRGFVWLEKGRLAGTPKPGIVGNPSDDIEALARVGVTRLLTLLEEPLEFLELLSEHRIRSVHVPVEDMGAPSIDQASRFCKRIDYWLKTGQVVAVHCLAGHGRTGTALGAYRIWQGQGVTEAVEGLRHFERRWIQSAEQVRFLEAFEQHLRSA